MISLTTSPWRWKIFNYKEGSLRAQLAAGAAGSSLLKVAQASIAFLTSVLLARLLGSEEYGTYVYLLTLIRFLRGPMVLGLPTLLVRLVAAYQLQSAWDLLHGLLRRANSFVCLTSFLVCSLAMIIAWSLRAALDSYSLMVLCIGLMLLPVETLGALRAAALHGFRHVIVAQLPEILVRPGLFIALVGIGALSFPSIYHNALAALVLQFVAAVVALLVATTYLRRRIPEKVRSASPTYDTRIWLRGALPLMFGGIMLFLNNRLGVLMLGSLAGAKEVGIYQAAAHVAGLIPVGLASINVVLAPTVSRLHVVGDSIRLQRLVTTSTRITFFLCLPVAVAFVVFSRQILITLFSPEFVSGAHVLSLLSVGQFVNVGMGSVALLLNMTGYERDTLKGYSFTVIVNLMLGIILIPKMGIIGAAIAESTSLISWNSLLAYMVYKRINIRSTILG